MQMTESHFRAILAEMIDENPLACRALLRLADLEFTDQVDTLAVTLAAQPRLLVNLGFVRQHCRDETHIRAVLLHEFLHVLLNHVERFTHVDDGLNWALDVVINALIHRFFGPTYSSFMSTYYTHAQGPARLLRPMKAQEPLADLGPLADIWRGVYAGSLVTDDLIQIADSLRPSGFVLPPDRTLLGQHPLAADAGLADETRRALLDTLHSLNGGGIWRSGRAPGMGDTTFWRALPAQDERQARWERTAWRALRQCLTPDPRAPTGTHLPRSILLPILNPRDRRGFVHSQWHPLLTDMVWETTERRPEGSVRVYLDVSGSMDAELQALVNLLWRLRVAIRQPFWAFTDAVAPATFDQGRLKTTSSGGTSINCVLRHIATTRPGKALIITDGYIERCQPRLLAALRGQTLIAIVSRHGSPAELERAGIPVMQLEEYPHATPG